MVSFGEDFRQSIRARRLARINLVTPAGAHWSRDRPHPHRRNHERAFYDMGSRTFGRKHSDTSKRAHSGRRPFAPESRAVPGQQPLINSLSTFFARPEGHPQSGQARPPSTARDIAPTKARSDPDSALRSRACHSRRAWSCPLRTSRSSPLRPVQGERTC